MTGIRATINPQQFFDQGVIKSNENNFPTARLIKLADLPSKAIPSLIHLLSLTIVGVAFTPLAILTMRRVWMIDQYASRTENADELLPKGYSALIKVLNPNYQEKGDHMGVISEKIATPIFDKAVEMAKKNDFFSTHVVSRTLFLSGILAAVTTRTMDLFLCIFWTALSFALLGQVDRINDFAFRQLAFLGVINDICSGSRHFVNPHA